MFQIASFATAHAKQRGKLPDLNMGGKGLDLQREKGKDQIEWDKEIKTCDEGDGWGEEN